MLLVSGETSGAVVNSRIATLTDYLGAIVLEESFPAAGGKEIHSQPPVVQILHLVVDRIVLFCFACKVLGGAARVIQPSA